MNADLDRSQRRLELMKAHLENALIEVDPSEKNYHIREPLQVIVLIEEDS